MPSSTLGTCESATVRFDSKVLLVFASAAPLALLADLRCPRGMPEVQPTDDEGGINGLDCVAAREYTRDWNGMRVHGREYSDDGV